MSNMMNDSEDESSVSFRIIQIGNKNKKIKRSGKHDFNFSKLKISKSLWCNFEISFSSAKIGNWF